MAKKVKNESIAVRVVAAQEFIETKPKEGVPYDVWAHLGASGEVAKSPVYYRNKKFKNAEKHFPHDPLMRTVDKYFPFAEGGELYIDEPETDEEIQALSKKASAIKSEGLRYIIIKRGEDYEGLEGTI